MQCIDFINFDRIQWCCDDARVSINELALEVSIPVEKINSKKPLLTFNQLNKIATFFGRGTLFFLSEDEVKKDHVHSLNFRTLANQKPDISIKLRKFIERVEFQRDRYLGILEDIETDKNIAFAPPALTKDVFQVSTMVRQWLNLKEQNTFETYRRAIEQRGILVFQSNGYNGKWQIPKESPILGFSLYDNVCPLIVVRKQQWPSQQVFTLMHELGHVLLHKTSSIDDANDFNSHKGREYQANQFAGLVLVPEEYLSKVNVATKPKEFSEYIEWLRPYCKVWGVSTEVILRRLADNGLIKLEDYEGFRYWSQNQKIPTKDGGSRSYRHREPQHIFGNRFVRSVFDAKNAQKLTLSKVSNYLDNLKIKDIQLLEKHLASN